jgi:hypothetical protein
VLLAALIAACSKPIAPGTPIAAAAAPAAEPSGVAWKHAANDADVDAAFAQAKASNMPVFVYWGAAWCPPCNQVKATVFNRQDFIERSRAFVPVYVDGDGPGAQKLGARFNVSGYPTMLLFGPQGTELTRLPGEVDAARYSEVLTLGMNAQHPVKDVLARALSPDGEAQALGANDWRLLAFYSWDTDEAQLVPKDDVAAVLAQLAGACPADSPDIAMRLRLRALAAADDKAAPPADPAQAAMVRGLLIDAPAARAHADQLTNYSAAITRALSKRGTPERAQLLSAFDAALKRLEADSTLSRADRLTALLAQVELARIDAPKESSSAAPRTKVDLPQALIADLREHTARLDREITDGYERQAVIASAAEGLAFAGLDEESDALLEANLARSRSPYYLMLGLASNAQARGDSTTALRWYEKAFNTSEGPATRLQWGAYYVDAMIELTPQDEARIETAAAQLLSEAAAQPDAFYERSGRSLQRIGSKLYGWNKDGAHNGAITRLQKQLDGLCDALDSGDPKRETCAALLKSPPKTTA